MVEILLPQGSPVACRARVERAGFSVREAEVPPVPPLEGSSADQVILIPGAIFASAGWARLRTGLSRAARFYVVEVTRSETADVVAAMRDGAFDVVARSESDERWGAAINAAARSQGLWLQLYGGRLDAEGARFAGQSAAMQDLRRTLERLGPTDVTVLLLGESGVGKERVAAALYEAGRGGPMVTLNCAAMPRELIEAELFGAEKGAFTGAVRSRPGLVEQANGGTLFLDEVGELDPAVQPKLLRFLETRRARRLGGELEYSVRVRVIAATNRDLEREVRSGRFRADLFYRLAEVVLRIPPLRARKEDIPDLARVFVSAANERFGKNAETLEPELLVRLQQYTWPGNIRELKGVVDRLVLFHEGPVLRAGWWEPPVLIGDSPEPVPIPAPTPGPTRASALEPTAGTEGGRAVEFGAPGAMPDGATGSTASSADQASLPGRAARLELAGRLLDEGRLSLAEVAARVGVHPTTLFRWRRAGKAGKTGSAARSEGRERDPASPAG